MGASSVASGGCARVRGWGEGWRGRRPVRGTVGLGAGGARSGSAGVAASCPTFSPPLPP